MLKQEEIKLETRRKGTLVKYFTTFSGQTVVAQTGITQTIEPTYTKVGTTFTGIRTNFVGKTATGEIVSGTEAFKEEGEYIETISIIGGNYLAIPIVRTYTIGEAKNT